MKVEINEIEFCKKKLNIEIPKDALDKEIDSIYNSLKNRVTVKGFRKGKVPRHVLEAHYSNDVQQEVLQKVIPKAYKEAIKKNNITVIGQPMVEDIKIEDNTPLFFTAVIDVTPEIEIKDYKGFKFTKSIKKVDEKAVDKELKSMQDRYAEYDNTEDGVVTDTDYVIIDIESLDKDVPMNENKEYLIKNHPVIIGSKSILPELENALIGMKKSDTNEVSATFPKDYFNKALAEKRVSFKLTVHEIKKKKVRDIDDEFAKEIGKCETLNELKSNLNNQLRDMEEYYAESKLSEDLRKKLISDNDFKVSDVMIERELNLLVSNASRSKSQLGEKFDVEKFKNDIEVKKAANDNAKYNTVLEKIADLENFTVSSIETDEEIKKIAYQNNMSFIDAKKNVSENGTIDNLILHIKRDKAQKFILENSEIENICIES